MGPDDTTPKSPEGAQMVAALAQLYRPRGQFNKAKPGMTLRDMQKRGRSVSQTQRTRWLSNRLYYLGEHYLRIVGKSVRTLAPPEKLPTGRRRDSINLLRRYVDGRISMMTWKAPAFQVLPAGYSADQLDAARLATKLVRAKWSEQEWDLTWNFRRLASAGEIDGVAWLNVVFDPSMGKKVKVVIDQETGQPVMQKDEADAAVLTGIGVEQVIRDGDVRFRVVRAGAIACDPAARDDFREASWIIETRVEDRNIVEAQSAVPISQLVSRHREALDDYLGKDAFSDVDYGQISVEDSEGTEQTVSMKDMVTTHVAYIKPHGEWPMGAHVKWLDIAPTQPIIVEPWDDELPYFPYTPTPHGGHFLKSRGMVDQLRPAQDRFNRVLTQLGEWLDRVARPPLIITNGSLSNETPEVFNSKGIIISKGTAAEPHFMSVPSEPTVLASNHLREITEWMGTIAVQGEATQGNAPGRVDSAVGIERLQQADEMQMSSPESELKRAMQWGVSRALRLVERHYSIPRLINAPGVTDSVEFNAFVGNKLKGATRFQVDGSLLPRSRAAQQDMLLKLVQMSGDKIDWTAHFSNMLDGDVGAIVEREKMEAQQQRRENADIIALHQIPTIDKIWQDFLEIQQAFMVVLKKGLTPAQMASKGIVEPSIKFVGVQLPPVIEGDRHVEHLAELDAVKASAEFKHFHPLVKQAFNEHRKEHVGRMSAMLNQGPPEEIGGSSQGGASPSRQKDTTGAPSAPKPGNL